MELYLARVLSEEYYAAELYEDIARADCAIDLPDAEWAAIKARREAYYEDQTRLGILYDEAMSTRSDKR